MSDNIFEEYRHMLIQLGEEVRLSEEEKKYQEIIKVVRQVASDNYLTASALLRHMVDDMGRPSHPSPVIEEATKWLKENRVYAWRGVNVAMKDWGPHSSEEQTQLVDCRDWQVHMAEYKLREIRNEFNKKPWWRFWSR